MIAFASAGDAKPNVLFIFADNMTFESIGAYGLSDCKTPNLDRLVGDGATFSQAYNMGAWSGAVCAASRAMLNSGSFVNRAQAKADEQPFFMYLAFNASHDPRQSPKEYINMYPLGSIKVPENFLSLHPFKDAMGCGPGLRDEKLAPFPRTEFAVKVHRQEYFAIITHMDAQIGRIPDALEATGMADNTYVIFTADHGLACGHHGLLGKQSMYDHSMRVPFMITGPDIKPGSSFKMPIYLQDAMATTLDLAGIAKPDYVEFKSLIPLIKGVEKVQYDSIYGKYINRQRIIAKGDWKLIFYPTIGKLRLFNTAKDPHEMRDLAENPEHATKLKELKVELKELQQAMGDKLDIDRPVKPAKKSGAANKSPRAASSSAD